MGVLLNLLKIWVLIVVSVYLLRFAVFMLKPFIALAVSEAGLVVWICEKWSNALRRWRKLFCRLLRLPDRHCDGQSPK